MLRFLTAGESHGRTLVAILDGVPSGLTIDFDHITQDLRRRQGGYGRGQRMAIESDCADFISGVRHGKTTGAPIALLIANKDWKNWQLTMHVEAAAPAGATGARRAAVVRPRPGHADLAGGLKYEHEDLRDVLERASARETAARVAVGAIARQLLRSVGVEIVSHVTGIGDILAPDHPPITFAVARAIADSPLHCADARLESAMIAAIDRAREAGDTLGGSFEVIAHGVPAGLGSHVQWDRKLDGRLAQALMSIPAIKAVGVGLGAAASRRPGSQVHDEIVSRRELGRDDLSIMRPTNRAGGLEGGVTNGEEVRVTAYMKPIATLMKPLRSVNLTTLDDAPAAIERSDVCAVPAAAVVGEAVVGFILADAVLERFGGDSMRQLHAHYRETNTRLRQRLIRRRQGHEGHEGHEGTEQLKQ